MAISQPTYPVTTSALVTHVGAYVDTQDAADRARLATLEAASGTAVLKSIVDAAGDLLVGSANDTVTRLAKGADGQVLKMAGGAVTWGTDSTGGGGGGTGSGLPANILTKTANFTAAAGDFILADAGGGAFQVTLPAGSAGDLISVKKVDGGGNAVAVDVTAGGTIDGDAGGASITSPQFGGIFECSSSGAWQLVSPMSPGGSNGTDGVDGADGSNGATGATGATGADGQTTVSANTQTTDYTLVIGDAGKAVEMNSGSARTITIPPNASVAFATGTVVELCRIGSGSVTIVQGAAVTLPNRLEAAGTSNRTIVDQWSSASIRKRGTNEWVLEGNIA